MTIGVEDGKVVSVEGFSCKRGSEYAVLEVTDPRRVLTTTVKVSGADIPVISVKSRKPLPKGLIFDCMKVLNGVEVEAPVKTGDTVVSNILGTGVDIVATKTVSKVGAAVL
jgi:CxxC motif-containing protein